MSGIRKQPENFGCILPFNKVVSLQEISVAFDPRDTCFGNLLRLGERSAEGFYLDQNPRSLSELFDSALLFAQAF